MTQAYNVCHQAREGGGAGAHFAKEGAMCLATGTLEPRSVLRGEIRQPPVKDL